VLVILFCFVFTFALDIFNNVYPFRMKNVILGLSNVVIGFGVTFLFEKIISDNSKKSVSQLKKRLIPSFIFFVLSTMILAFISVELGLYVLFLQEGRSTNEFFSQIFNVKYTGAIICLVAGIFFSSIVFFYKTWKQAVDRQQQLVEENLKYRYQTLKTQINPHFLFNSLNTLSEMVYEDAEKADNYIQKLSGIYRYILDNEETDLVLLTKEIEFVLKYFELKKERDDNKIVLDLHVNDPEKFRIIPVSLQILVENALKHNSASVNKPLKINIHTEDMLVVVSNNMQKKNTLDNSYGTGLSNLKERAKLITGRKMIVSQNNNEFTVKIPIISI
ncbi:MAG: histidine kinase, partial [Bacteroidales bacterium]|nr:histidine kinase [Bacteroidales bacterium]